MALCYHAILSNFNYNVCVMLPPFFLAVFVFKMDCTCVRQLCEFFKVIGSRLEMAFRSLEYRLIHTHSLCAHSFSLLVSLNCILYLGSSKSAAASVKSVKPFAPLGKQLSCNHHHHHHCLCIHQSRIFHIMIYFGWFKLKSGISWG